MTIDDVRTVEEFSEYIIDSHYREEPFEYAEVMNRVEERIKWLNEHEDDEHEDDFLGSLNYKFRACRKTITLYRTIPQTSRRPYYDKENVDNVGMSWVTSIEELKRIPWYDDKSTILSVTIPTNDKTYIAFANFTDRIVEVVLPNASKHYQIEVYRARRKRTKRLRRNK